MKTPSENPDRDSAKSEGTEAGRDRFASYRDRLASYGFHPSKRLGQNFLLDPSLHKMIAGVAEPCEHDLILEIGPGLGFLTRELAARSRVLAVEVDDRLVRILREEIATHEHGDRIRLLHCDALRGGHLHTDVVEAICDELETLGSDGRFLVVANLPYAISGPLISELALLSRPPVGMVLLIQLEMARRLAARVGTREYGSLSAMLQLGYDIDVLRKVSSQVFRPRPQVDSGIVHLQALPGGVLEENAASRQDLGAFLRSVFASRRKKLRNAPVIAAALAGGIELETRFATMLELRPDAIGPSDLAALWARLALEPGE